MKNIRRLLLTVAAIFAGVVALAVADYFYVSTDSWGAFEFRSKLASELERQGRARIGDLVNFKWAQVYLVSPYELAGDPRRSKEIGGSEDWVFWWYDDEMVWTIVFRRPGASPFLIKMPRREWEMRGPKLSATNPDAKFVWVKQGHPEYSNCDRSTRFCLVLE